jgi:hypothetical protein
LSGKSGSIDDETQDDAQCGGWNGRHWYAVWWYDQVNEYTKRLYIWLRHTWSNLLWSLSMKNCLSSLFVFFNSLGVDGSHWCLSSSHHKEPPILFVDLTQHTLELNPARPLHSSPRYAVSNSLSPLLVSVHVSYAQGGSYPLDCYPRF